MAFITARSKLLVVTFAAEELLGLAAERLIDQRRLAHRTEEALLVPVTIFV